MKRHFATLILIVMVSSATGQIISFSPLKVSFGGNQKKNWYKETVTDADADGDPGAQSIEVKYQKNSPGAGWTTTQPVTITELDCNDARADINHNASEVCNGLDDDCDSLIDDGIPVKTYWFDNDNDGYGDPNNAVALCFQPLQYVENSADCNDMDASVVVPKMYFTDTNGDGCGEDTTFLCASVAPVGYTDVKCDPDLILTSSGSQSPAGFHGVNGEAGFYDKKNYYINWLEPRYWDRLTQLGIKTYGYPGSSISHTWYPQPADTIDATTLFNAYNGNLLWCNESCTPSQQQGYVVNGSIIDGANCIRWNESFTPLMSHIAQSIGSDIVPIFNAGTGDVNKFITYLNWLTDLGVNSGWVAYGAEMGLSGYCDAQTASQYRTGLDQFISTMRPLGYKIIADATPIQRSRFQPGTWNWEVAQSTADGYDVYWLSSDFFTVTGTSFNAYRDSVVKSNTLYVPHRIDSLRTMFSGKKIYCHQWAVATKQFQGTVLEELYCASFSNAVLSYMASYPDLMQFFLYNGNKNLGMENSIVSPSWYAIKQQGTLMNHAGNILVSGQTPYGVSVVGIKSDSGIVIRVTNLSDVPVSMPEIEVDGWITKSWTGDCYYGNSLNSSSVLYKNITDGIIPPYSDTIIRL